MKPIRVTIVLSLVALLLLTGSTKSLAAMITMGMDQMFGAQSVSPNSTTTPWTTAAFSDNGDGTVNLTLKNPNLTGIESVGNVYLNFDDSLDVTKLQFSVVSSSGSFNYNSAASSYSLSPSTSGSQQRADGDGYYDIVLNGFMTGNDPTKTFGLGDTLTLKISTTQPSTSLNVADFEFKSDANAVTTGYYAAEHVMNTGMNFNKGAFLRS